MKRFFTPLILALAATAAFAQTSLTIGDMAPEFKTVGHIKGDKITKLEKGKPYIIEFWATWCGPCIAVFPHLSELTKKYEGQVTTISINSWDWRDKNVDLAAHSARIKEFVEKQGDKMSYNIVLDDQSDTMANTWMRAAGQNGIPCAFIVNEEGRIAWIGHPAVMDKPLEQIVNKTWNLQAFKKEFDAEIAKEVEAQKDREKIMEIAKAGDMAAFEEMVKKMGARDALFAAINGEANFAARVIEKYAGKIEGLTPDTYCSMAAFLTKNKALNTDSRATLVKVSEMCFAEQKEDKAAMTAAYHAQILLNNGDKAGAQKWIEKAETLLAKYMPENGRARVQSMIDGTKKALAAN
jgi:thiol-disulfide isomerase/thioredoxin